MIAIGVKKSQATNSEFPHLCKIFHYYNKMHLSPAAKLGKNPLKNINE